MTLLIWWSGLLNAQNIVEIQFHPDFAGEVLSIGEAIENTDGQISQIDLFRLYISGVSLFDGTETVYQEVQSFHLLDAEELNSLRIQLQTEAGLSFTHIGFKIGIDSLTSVSGAMGGDLDPTLGMYWTWQSGYVNFKLEGIAPKCPARHHRFQYHIGGYQFPFNTLQEVRLPVLNREKVDIQIAIDRLFQSIDMQTTYLVMSPNQAAVTLSRKLPALFSIQ
ncbi:MAG: MbnP family protein [Bacteroidota bacterium]